MSPKWHTIHYALIHYTVMGYALICAVYEFRRLFCHSSTYNRVCCCDSRVHEVSNVCPTFHTLFFSTNLVHHPSIWSVFFTLYTLLALVKSIIELCISVWIGTHLYFTQRWKFQDKYSPYVVPTPKSFVHLQNK